MNTLSFFPSVHGGMQGGSDSPPARKGTKGGSLSPSARERTKGRSSSAFILHPSSFILLFCFILHPSSFSSAQLPLGPWNTGIYATQTAGRTVHDTTNIPPVGPTVTITAPESGGTEPLSEYLTIELTITQGDTDITWVIYAFIHCTLGSDAHTAFYTYEPAAPGNISHTFTMDTEHPTVNLYWTVDSDIRIWAYIVDANGLYDSDMITFEVIAP